MQVDDTNNKGEDEQPVTVVEPQSERESDPGEVQLLDGHESRITQILQELKDLCADRPVPNHDGASLIAAERRRQVEEGVIDQLPWSEGGTFVIAAILYAGHNEPALPPIYDSYGRWEFPWPDLDQRGKVSYMRLLVMAGAFIAAEIDRRIAAG